MKATRTTSVIADPFATFKSMPICTQSWNEREMSASIPKKDTAMAGRCPLRIDAAMEANSPVLAEVEILHHRTQQVVATVTIARSSPIADSGIDSIEGRP